MAMNQPDEEIEETIFAVYYESIDLHGNEKIHKSHCWRNWIIKG